MKPITYKDAGVDLELGDECSQIMYEASHKTWQNRRDIFGEILSESDYFGALRYIRVPEESDLVLGLNSDGVGTKIELAERAGDHSNVAFDLFAMVCDDAAIRGAEPILLSSVLDVKKTNIDVVKELSEGMIKAANECNVCVINGELAEIGERVGGYGGINYNWSATILWATKKSLLKKSIHVIPGTKIIAVKENGIRSNGLSLVRRIMLEHYGEEWHTQPKGHEILQWALIPSRIYTKLLIKMQGGLNGNPAVEISGAVHVTGGGIPGKLGRLLKQAKLGAKLDNLFPPPENIHDLQRLGNIPDEECYKTWNMGQGLLILCQDAERVKEFIDEMGFESRIAGEVIKESKFFLKSNGIEKPGESLSFSL